MINDDNYTFEGAKMARDILLKCCNLFLSLHSFPHKSGYKMNAFGEKDLVDCGYILKLHTIMFTKYIDDNKYMNTENSTTNK